MSPVLEVLQALVATAGWAIAGALILYGAIWLFDRVDPIDYQREIRQGNVAAAIALGAVTLAIGAIVVAVLVT